jgi:hypothetical protein
LYNIKVIPSPIIMIPDAHAESHYTFRGASLAGDEAHEQPAILPEEQEGVVGDQIRRTLESQRGATAKKATNLASGASVPSEGDTHAESHHTFQGAALTGDEAHQ